jgi:hypothetical protein
MVQFQTLSLALRDSVPCFWSFILLIRPIDSHYFFTLSYDGDLVGFRFGLCVLL